MNELAPNPLNPRRIKEQKLDMLSHSMARWGDLGCIVYNRQTERLIAGHQRVKNLSDWEIVIEHRFDEPTVQGTVAIGYIVKTGETERFAYREVSFSQDDEIAAMLAANNNAGEYKRNEVAGLVLQLDEANYDLSLTMFDEEEVKSLFDATVVSLDDEEAPEDKSIVTKTCPSCGFELSNG